MAYTVTSGRRKTKATELHFPCGMLLNAWYCASGPFAPARSLSASDFDLPPLEKNIKPPFAPQSWDVRRFWYMPKPASVLRNLTNTVQASAPSRDCNPSTCAQAPHHPVARAPPNEPEAHLAEGDSMASSPVAESIAHEPAHSSNEKFATSPAFCAVAAGAGDAATTASNTRTRSQRVIFPTVSSSLTFHGRDNPADLVAVYYIKTGSPVNRTTTTTEIPPR